MPVPLIALLTPFALAVSLALPLYMGMVAAVYLIYGLKGPQMPDLDLIAAPWQMIQAYGALFDFWRTHQTQVDLLTYAAPLWALPMIGGVGSFLLVRWVVRVIQGWLEH